MEWPFLAIILIVALVISGDDKSRCDNMICVFCDNVMIECNEEE